MAVRDHVSPGLAKRSRVSIVTVDPTRRVVEGAQKDGSMLSIAVWDVPNAFRWPIVGEIWIVRQDTGLWVLDHRQQNAKDESARPITAMRPGQMLLDSANVIDIAGKTFVAVDLAGIQNGWTLKWDATSNSFIASP